MATTNHTGGAMKKYFYSGVGFMAHSKEMMQKSADEIARQGRYSEAEGKKVVNEMVNYLEDRYNGTIHKMGQWANSEVSRLNSGLAKMERKLAIQNKKYAPGNGSKMPLEKARRMLMGVGKLPEARYRRHENPEKTSLKMADNETLATLLFVSYWVPYNLPGTKKLLRPKK